MQIATLMRVLLGLSALGFGASTLGLLPENSSEPTNQQAVIDPASGGAAGQQDYVRRSYYQASASLSDGLPSLPAGLPTSSSSSALSDMPSLPSAGLPPPPNSNPQTLPAANPQALPPASALPMTSAIPTGNEPVGIGTDAPVELPNGSFQGGFPQGSSSRGNTTDLGRSAVVPAQGASSAQPILPGPQSGPPAALPQGNRLSAAPAALPSTPGQRGVPAQPATHSSPTPEAQNGLRTWDNMRRIQEQGGPSASRPSQPVVNGPPFVTGPPRSRYFTTPYNHALFQTAAFQRDYARQSPANAPVGTSPTATRPGQLTSAVVNQNISATLPQFANTPGYYPTSYQCGPPVINSGNVPPSLPPVGAVPGTSVPPTITPNLAPNLYSPNNGGYAPLLSLGQEGYNIQVGRGILGQPTVYVPGQPVRNFLRYLFP